MDFNHIPGFYKKGLRQNSKELSHGDFFSRGAKSPKGKAVSWKGNIL
jgi:hypothetical protein